jgi:neutral ceramidase
MGRYSSLMALGLALLLAATSAAALPPSTSAAAQQYLAGVGIADVTGPAAEVNMMGYAVMEQSAKGIHTRQWARAFIFGDSGGAR